MALAYPIAEVFLAPQGEGFNVGTLMVFVRLAGCTVGKRYSVNMYEPRGKVLPPIFPIYTNECTTADGRTFACDTDYRKHHSFTYEQLKACIVHVGDKCKQICLTGGEPLMHAKTGTLLPLVSAFKADGYSINLETSGTIPVGDIEADVLDHIDHIAVSPKKGYLVEYNKWMDECKLLVDKDFDLSKFAKYDLPPEKVFLQPINNEHTVNEDNIKICLEIQKQNPEFRISLQTHKIWNSR